MRGAVVPVKGYVQWDLVRNGFSLTHGEGPNLVTQCGLDWIADRISNIGDSSPGDDMQYIKAGTSDKDTAMTDVDIDGTLWMAQVCGNDGGDPAGEPGGTGINPGEANTVLWRAKLTYDADVHSALIVREMVLGTTNVKDALPNILARFLTGPEGIRGYVDGDSIVVVWALTIGE
jgi:hypothetical protein